LAASMSDRSSVSVLTPVNSLSVLPRNKINRRARKRSRV
jgi:hypothetical protein